jgi:hypothetical protein
MSGNSKKLLVILTESFSVVTFSAVGRAVRPDFLSQTNEFKDMVLLSKHKNDDIGYLIDTITKV